MTARLAPPSAFKQAGVDFASSLSGVRVAVDKRGARPVLVVTSDRAVNEPFLDVLIELNWASGRLVREYTFLLDPADMPRSAPVEPSVVKDVAPRTAPVVRAAAQPEPRISGVILRPDPVWVRALDRQTRARIYGMLAKTELNTDQAQAFRYRGDNLEEWLAPDLISPRLRQIVEPLVYREGNYMLFSDIELVRAEVGGEDEMRQLSKTLFRQPTFLARLSVDSTANLDALVEYWGRGGRRTQIRPLLESVAADRSDQSIDVTYLLPPFARNHLYHYPELSAADLDRPMVVNCLWTALNFFQPEPDDRFLDVATALRTLKEDYFVVESDFELGDIVAFLDEKGNIFHAAVYVADNLVFGKNGISAMAPWTILPLEDVKGYYRWRSENPRLIVHRRKGF